MNSTNKISNVIYLVLLIAVVETISLVCLKKGNNENGLVVYILYKALSNEGIGKVNLMWNCVTIITAFVTGNLLFNEQINKYTFYSIVFAFIAIYFLYLSGNEA